MAARAEAASSSLGSGMVCMVWHVVPGIVVSFATRARIWSVRHAAPEFGRIFNTRTRIWSAATDGSRKPKITANFNKVSGFCSASASAKFVLGVVSNSKYLAAK